MACFVAMTDLVYRRNTGCGDDLRRQDVGGCQGQDNFLQLCISLRRGLSRLSMYLGKTACERHHIGHSMIESKFSGFGDDLADQFDGAGKVCALLRLERAARAKFHSIEDGDRVYAAVAGYRQ